MKLRHLLLIALLVPVLCSARTWRVEKDGSGDYTNIQPAVDAASPQDTVLVGPGRYDTFWLFDSSLNWEVIVGVSVDSLTIIGTDRETVIIGPTSLYPPQVDSADRQENTSYGIAYRVTNHWGVVENLTFENTWVGVNLYPSGIVRNCTFRGMWYFGIHADKAIKTTITGCETYECTSAGIRIRSYGIGQILVDVSDCRVEGSQTGYYITHPNTVMTNCIAVGCNTGFALGSGRATYNNILADGCYGGVVSDAGAILSVYNSIIRNSLYGDISAIAGGYIHGSNLILAGGGAGETIYSANGLLDIHSSHIGHSIARSVRVNYHIGPDDAMDLTGNYWGTTSADSIAAWIWDSHDDPSILTTVRYEPFSPTPLPNENRSMGDVKAMFRR